MKTIIQTVEVNTSHISSINAEHINALDIQELIWPISNSTQLVAGEKFLTDTDIRKNEVRCSYIYFNKKLYIIVSNCSLYLLQFFYGIIYLYDFILGTTVGKISGENCFRINSAYDVKDV